MRRLAFLGVLFLLFTSAAGVAQASARTLFVCNGSTSPCPQNTQPYSTIQGAVDAAHAGDWILIWPGVYHEKATAKQGVLITTPDLHLRGLDRNRVIVDGSNGSAGNPCPADKASQDFTARSGVVVSKASGGSIENLTVCDYLAAAGGGQGNEIWWNGGDGSGKIGMGAFKGDYLTATSLYTPSAASDPQQWAYYGIFASNAAGPGLISHSYAANMADSDYYVGACARVCNTTLDHVRATNSQLGYSGTNAGGKVIIRNSEWDNNRTGLAPNTLNNEDAPPPQDGRCPGSQTQSCFVIENNYIHDNNNPNVPSSGVTPALGAGVELSGGKYDTVRYNRIENQGAWGIVTHDFPDPSAPPPVSHCEGGVQISTICYFRSMGDQIYGNHLAHNGSFKNPTNGDLANQAIWAPQNCFTGNVDTAGKLTTDPAGLQTAPGKTCGRPGDTVLLFAELLCSTGFTTCIVPNANYPARTHITMAALPRLTSMPHPCRGLPAATWCRD